MATIWAMSNPWMRKSPIKPAKRPPIPHPKDIPKLADPKALEGFDSKLASATNEGYTIA